MLQALPAARHRPLFALLALAASTACAQPLTQYVFAVVPQYSATDLYNKDWAPVLQRASRESGVLLELKIATAIPQFASLPIVAHPRVTEDGEGIRA